MNRVVLRVVGLPAPQGSKRHVGHGILVESSKRVGQWRQDVIAQSSTYHGLRLDGPLHVQMTFYLPRPRSRRRGTFCDRRPDLSKLVRSTEDALVDAAIIADDARIVVIGARKEYTDDGGQAAPGACIEITRLRGDA